MISFIRDEVYVNNKEKLRYLLREEVFYLSMSLAFGLITYFNYSFLKSLEIFFYTALFFQFMILISNWNVIFNKNR